MGDIPINIKKSPGPGLGQIFLTYLYEQKLVTSVRWLLSSAGTVLSSLSTIGVLLLLLLLLLCRGDLWVGPGWVLPSHSCGGLLIDFFLQLIPESLLGSSGSPGF